MTQSANPTSDAPQQEQHPPPLPQQQQRTIIMTAEAQGTQQHHVPAMSPTQLSQSAYSTSLASTVAAPLPVHRDLHNNNNAVTVALSKQWDFDRRAAPEDKLCMTINFVNECTMDYLRLAFLQMFICFAPHQLPTIPTLLAKSRGNTRRAITELRRHYSHVPLPEEAKTCLSRCFRTRVCVLYAWYNPAMIPEVDKVLAKYWGQEEELWQALRKKYGEEKPAQDLYSDWELKEAHEKQRMRQAIARLPPGTTSRPSGKNGSIHILNSNDSSASFSESMFRDPRDADVVWQRGREQRYRDMLSAAFPLDASGTSSETTKSNSFSVGLGAASFAQYSMVGGDATINSNNNAMASPVGGRRDSAFNDIPRVQSMSFASSPMGRRFSDDAPVNGDFGAFEQSITLSRGWGNENDAAAELQDAALDYNAVLLAMKVDQSELCPLSNQLPSGTAATLAAELSAVLPSAAVPLSAPRVQHASSVTHPEQLRVAVALSNNNTSLMSPTALAASLTSSHIGSPLSDGGNNNSISPQQQRAMKRRVSFAAANGDGAAGLDGSFSMSPNTARGILRRKSEGSSVVGASAATPAGAAVVVPARTVPLPRLELTPSVQQLTNHNNTNNNSFGNSYDSFPQPLQLSLEDLARL